MVKRTRKGTRRVKRSRQSTRRMRMRGGLNLTSLNPFTKKNNARAPRREGPARERSVLYQSAIDTYKANKGKLDTLVKNLKEAVNTEVRKDIVEYNINSSDNTKKELIVAAGITPERLKEITSAKISVSTEGSKEARDAFETLLKLSVSEKKSSIREFIKSHMNMVPGAKKAMEYMGVQNESINSLFDSIDNDTMTVGKAELLLLLIKNKHLLLTDTAKRNLGLTGGNQRGGMTSGDSFGMWTIAVALAIPTSGISLIIALIIEIFADRE